MAKGRRSGSAERGREGWRNSAAEKQRGWGRAGERKGTRRSGRAARAPRGRRTRKCERGLLVFLWSLSGTGRGLRRGDARRRVVAGSKASGTSLQTLARPSPRQKACKVAVTFRFANQSTQPTDGVGRGLPRAFWRQTRFGGAAGGLWTFRVFPAFEAEPKRRERLLRAQRGLFGETAVRRLAGASRYVLGENLGESAAIP